MQLRSGKIYDASFPQRCKEFATFHNPRFCAIWDDSLHVFVDHYKADDSLKSARIASMMFSKHVIEKIKAEIGYHA